MELVEAPRLSMCVTNSNTINSDERNISTQKELTVDAFTVPCLLLFSKTMMFALAGILVVHSADPPKAAKSLSSAWLLYPAWGSAWGPGWRRCRGQRNAISTGRLKRGRAVHLTLRSNAWTAAWEFDKAETLAVSSEKGEDGSKENWKSDSGRGPVKVVNLKRRRLGHRPHVCLTL